MKKIFSYIHKPKHIAVVSLVIAAIVGVIGYTLINQTPAYRFAQARAGSIQTAAAQSATSTNDLTLAFLASGQVESVLVKVGDQVTAGETLATLDPENTAGALTQAKAAYATALANYNKLVNGATPADISVSTASLDAAQTALAHSNETLLQTLNDSVTSALNAVSNDTDAFFNNPESAMPQLSISGATFSDQTLVYKIQDERAALNQMFPSWKAELSALDANSDLSASTDDAQKDLQSVAAYLDDLNTLLTTYTSAGSDAQIAADQDAVSAARASMTAQIASLTGASQAVSSAQASVAQNQANLTLKTSSPRPEDIAAAQAQVSNASGAVQIAESAYDNYIITAPTDGVVNAIYITVGQTAEANAPVINLAAESYMKNVSVMIPNSAIIDESGTDFVLVKKGKSVAEEQIAIGISDATNTEVLSGVSAGDQVVIH